MRLAAFQPDAPFLPSLARSWLNAPGEPSRGLIILPNRRSARALAGAFLQANGGKALLLPRIIALGGMDEAALIINEQLDLPPAISPYLRQALLTKLILAKQGKDGAPTKISTAWSLAADLAALIDEADLAEIKLQDVLPNLVRADLASHWEKTLDFLEIVTDAWPRILQEMGMVNPVFRQNAVIDAQKDAWARNPPDEKIWLIVRDFNPSLHRLVKVVAALSLGAVIFPGYDTEISAAAWEAVDDTHPQRKIAKMLAALGARREDVEIWPGMKSAVPPCRKSLISSALLPASELGEWQTTSVTQPEMIHKLVARDEHYEAMAIAVALRDCLENPDRTAALITPDRGLALRVSTQLLRFRIVADDSAGEALRETPPAVFLRLLAQAVESEFAPVPLLALLKHPLAANGTAPEICREQARELERSALRGPRPPPGLDGVKFRLQDISDRACADFLDRLERRLSPLIGLPLSINPAELMRALIQAGENLAASDTEPGAQRLWQGEAGVALSDLLTEMFEPMTVLPDIAGTEMSALLEAILTDHVVRRPRTKDGHPRVAIWGIQEASLQTVDFAILGGILEGVWPEIADPGPWMSRPMRKQAGFASSEERIGGSAHDFFSLCCQTPNLILTASERRGRAPAVPARWLTRLEALLKGHCTALQQHSAVSWANQIDVPKQRLFRPKPRPTPPLRFRPTKLSITEVATLISDPYAIYVAKILNIRESRGLDEESDAGLFGNIVHAGLADFFSHFDFSDHDGAVEALETSFVVAMRRERPRPALARWWEARLKRVAKWIIETEMDRRAEFGPPDALVHEQNGVLEIGRNFSITGRVDRIERRADGSIFIADYKTGTAPEAGQLLSGSAPQLPLEAVMAEAGVFGEQFRGPVTELAVWKLSGGRIEGVNKPLIRSPEELRNLIDRVRQAVPALFEKFQDSGTAYLSAPHPHRILRYNKLNGISRQVEWMDEDKNDALAH